MPRKNKLVIPEVVDEQLLEENIELKDAEVGSPIAIVEPKKEELNYEVVDINGKNYKKFSRPDGTTYLELI